MSIPLNPPQRIHPAQNREEIILPKTEQSPFSICHTEIESKKTARRSRRAFCFQSIAHIVVPHAGGLLLAAGVLPLAAAVVRCSLLVAHCWPPATDANPHKQDSRLATLLESNLCRHP